MKQCIKVLIFIYKLFVYIVGTIVLIGGIIGTGLLAWVSIADAISRSKEGKTLNDC